ncbi:hypothetical protein K503DRAFT_458167 [Rhizopogon vinicolor AM-OR11-026]|uniref:Uncharacterized protein n=1 Tax=Rhizopogon vinicolor AM-OR11-026 TaxID=1314800 RepID=A0A1B7NA67_9AGAM|nr:hypothetical protein K503DRAFT_458167 [Rhizopogon vinicolor AM-OR11-026]
MVILVQIHSPSYVRLHLTGVAPYIGAVCCQPPVNIINIGVFFHLVCKSRTLHNLSKDRECIDKRNSGGSRSDSCSTES